MATPRLQVKLVYHSPFTQRIAGETLKSATASGVACGAFAKVPPDAMTCRLLAMFCSRSTVFCWGSGCSCWENSMMKAVSIAENNAA